MKLCADLLALPDHTPDGKQEWHLTPTHYEALRTIGHLNRARKKEHVFQAGAPIRYVYFLLNGQIKLFHTSTSGRQIIKWFCRPGEFFGLTNLQANSMHDLYAQACIDSEFLVVPMSEFNQLLAHSPEMAMVVVHHLSRQLNTASDIILTLTYDNSDTKVIKLLLRLARQFGIEKADGIFLDTKLTHQEMADMVGMCRQTMTSTLNRFKRKGLIRIEHQTIILVDQNSMLNLLEI